MRKGEALALTWDDVDFTKNEIFINHAARTDKNDDGKVTIKSPKTRAGIRIVPMIQPLRDILMQFRKKTGFVVVDNITGKPIHSDATYNTMWRHIRNELDLKGYTAHSFRHAVATLFIANGVDIKTTQTILGHSQASTTMNIYVHAVPRNIENAGKLFTERVLCI